MDSTGRSLWPAFSKIQIRLWADSSRRFSQARGGFGQPRGGFGQPRGGVCMEAFNPGIKPLLFSLSSLRPSLLFHVTLPSARSMSEAAAEVCEPCNSSGFVEEDATAAITDIEDNEDTEQEQVAHVQITPQRSLAEAIDHWEKTPICDRVYVTPCQKDGTWCSGCEKKEFCQEFIIRYFKVLLSKTTGSSQRLAQISRVRSQFRQRRTDHAVSRRVTDAGC